MTAKQFADFLESSQEEFISSLSDTQEYIYKKIVDIILDKTNGGKFELSNLDMAELEDEIIDVLKKSDYSKIITNYLELFTVIESRIITEQAEINNIKANRIREIFKKSQSNDFIKNKIVDSLKGLGVKQSVIKPLSDLLKQNSIFNTSSKELKDIISKHIKDNNIVKRYVSQITNDALNQYDGAMNNEIKLVFGYDKLRYIGNVIETSRPICTHIMHNFNGNISESDLKKVLNEYCPNGKPSQSQIEYETINGVIRKSKKGAGMIDDTTMINFTQNRGGYECRHRAI